MRRRHQVPPPPEKKQPDGMDGNGTLAEIRIV
jgi:hypothetical protein